MMSHNPMEPDLAPLGLCDWASWRMQAGHDSIQASMFTERRGLGKALSSVIHPLDGTPGTDMFHRRVLFGKKGKAIFVWVNKMFAFCPRRMLCKVGVAKSRCAALKKCNGAQRSSRCAVPPLPLSLSVSSGYQPLPTSTAMAHLAFQLVQHAIPTSIFCPSVAGLQPTPVKLTVKQIQ